MISPVTHLFITLFILAIYIIVLDMQSINYRVQG
jgi:hypothetical protein